MLLGHFRHVGRVYVAIRRRRLAPHLVNQVKQVKQRLAKPVKQVAIRLASHLVKQLKPARQVYAADASHRT